MGTPDLSEFEQLSKPKRPTCPIGLALPALTDQERASLEGALAKDKGEITNAAIAEWLKRRGHKANFQAVTSHRSLSCTCHE